MLDLANDGEVLQVVRAVIGVERVVGVRTSGAEIDAEPSVVVDGVAADDVAGVA